MSYLQSTFYDNIAQGRYANISAWTKVGYNPSITTAEESVWSAGGLYEFSPTAQQMECVSTEATNDIGTNLKSATADAGGSTTTLVAATILTFAGGLSRGGVGTSRVYDVLDYSATTGAQAVKVEYLNGSYVEDSEIVITNGQTARATVQTDLYRINSFRVICAGSTNAAVGNLSIRETDDAPVYSYILGGFTRGRNSAYTVPAGHTLYVTDFNLSWSTPNDTKIQSARFYVRANQEPRFYFNTGNIFYPYGESIVSNASVELPRPVPQKFAAKTDLVVNGIAFAAGAGAASSIMRGYLVTG